MTLDISIQFDEPIAPELPPLPDPAELPACFVAGVEHNGLLARLNHDHPYPRTRDHVLTITNEISILRPIRADGLSVARFNKITINITNLLVKYLRYIIGTKKALSVARGATSLINRFANAPAAIAVYSDTWVDEFIRLNGEWLAELLFQPAIGWFDTGFPAFNMLMTGGNIIDIKPDGFQFPGYVEIKTQDFGYGPQGFDYDVSPQLVNKITLVGGYDTVAVRVDPKRGDGYIPLVSNTRTFVSMQKLDSNEQGITFFPDVPADTYLNGHPVLVTAYAFHGSDTYVQVNNLWYLAEEMIVSGEGRDSDRRTYCDLLKNMPCPPPIIGWTRLE